MPLFFRNRYKRNSKLDTVLPKLRANKLLRARTWWSSPSDEKKLIFCRSIFQHHQHSHQQQLRVSGTHQHLRLKQVYNNRHKRDKLLHPLMNHGKHDKESMLCKPHPLLKKKYTADLNDNTTGELTSSLQDYEPYRSRARHSPRKSHGKNDASPLDCVSPRFLIFKHITSSPSTSPPIERLFSVKVQTPNFNRPSTVPTLTLI